MLLAGVRDGEDPAQERLEGFAAPTVADLAERFLRDHANKKKTAYEDKRVLTKYILPALKTHLVEAVTARDIDRLHAAIGERAPVQANRVIQLASTMFRLAERWQMRPEGTNPCRHVKRFRERPRERYLSESEFARLGVAIREVEAEGRTGSGMTAAIRLIILTGARVSASPSSGHRDR